MKKTLKIMALIIAIIMLFSTYCFADEEVSETPSVISAPVEEGTMDDVPLLISTNDDEDSQIKIDDEAYGDTDYQTYTGDYFNANDTVNVSNLEIYGNVFVAGATVTVSNVDISGNLFIAGQSLTLKNVWIDGSVFIAGQQIKFDEVSVREIYSAGNVITLNQSSVSRTFYAGAENVTIDGSIVFGKANVGCNTLEIKGSYLNEDLNYSAPVQAEIDNDTTINGTINFVEENKDSESNPATKEIGSMYYFMQCITFVVLVGLVAAVFIWGPKKYFEMARKEELVTSMLKSFGIGFLGIVAVPVAFIVLLITVVGLPIAFVLLLAYILLLIISTASMTCFIMFNVLKNRYTSIDKSEDKLKMFALLLIAGCCVWLFRALPIVGGFVGLILVVSGFGSLIRCMYLNLDKIKEKKPAEVVVKAEDNKEEKEEQKDEDKKDSKKDN